MDLVLQSGLLAPVEYWFLSPEQKKDICNGCGAKASKFDFVPDVVFGAVFRPCCDIHDFCYWIGEDKRLSDSIFLYNLTVCCGVDCETDLLYAARVEAAIAYFRGVSAFGYDSFGMK